MTNRNNPEQQQKIDEVIAVEKAWVEAHRQLNPDTLASIMSHNYTQISDSGEVLGRADVLPTYQTDQRHWEIAEADQYQVRIYGDTAVVIGRWRGKGVNHGQPFDYQARFMAIYAKESGRWQLVADQSTPIPT